jgi:RNA polymerase sigma factor (sigma-70 family)
VISGIGGSDLPDRGSDQDESSGEAAVYIDWESVYRENVVGIYQLIMRRVGNAADAEDLAAEVLMRSLRTLRLPAPAHDVRAYLVKTARTVLADFWRRHYAAQATISEIELLPTDASLAGPNETANDRAQRLLALLPERFTRILELRFLRGYSVRETAREMGLTEANVRVIQFRALRKAAEYEEEVLG